MRAARLLTLALFLGACCSSTIPVALAQISIGISVNVEPPPLPVYAQPIIPAPGYLWVPGYWAWSDDVGYYWVPGTWILPPQPGLLWTPGYWGWNDGAYVFNDGYWGPQIGFYGGVNYGFGYTGAGYEGGYWRGGSFFYNSSVNNISSVSITNVYNKTVVVNNTSNVSYNGGAGGTTVRPTPEQVAAAKERHVAATPEQTRHAQEAAKDPALSLANNQGHPSVAATARPAEFKGPGVVAARPGEPVVRPKPSAPSTLVSPSKPVAPSKPEAPSHASPVSPQPGAKPATTVEHGTAEEKKKKLPPSPGAKPQSSGTNEPAIPAKPITPAPPPTAHNAAPPPAKPAPPPPKPTPQTVHTASPPPPHPAPPPSRPPGKPKCEPGKPCP